MRHRTENSKARYTRRAHGTAHFFFAAAPVVVLFAAGFFLTAGAVVVLEELAVAKETKVSADGGAMAAALAGAVQAPRIMKFIPFSLVLSCMRLRGFTAKVDAAM